MEFIKFNPAFSLAEIVDLAKKIKGSNTLLETQLFASPDQPVVGVTNGRSAAAGALCFVDRTPAPEALPLLKSAFVITDPSTARLLPGCTLIVTDDPRALFIDFIGQIQASNGFATFSSLTATAPAVHPDAIVHPGAVIEDGVHIGDGTHIAAGCVIKRGSYLGKQVIVRENTVIGSDGIALYKAKDGRVLRFPHLAGVIIEDNVEIGASCVIGGGVLNASKIGKNSVIGNLSNLGHGVQLGAKVWMSVGCLIGGNSHIGEQSSLGLGVCLRDNLRIGANCSIGMGSVVVNDLPADYAVFGNPARRLPDVKAGPDR
jgi:UDP-3-O-[3-hydroxymyristoyl] glucosamine N-acyltransferase LpxD